MVVLVSYIVSEYSLVEVKKERLKTSMVQQTLLLIKKLKEMIYSQV